MKRPLQWDSKVPSTFRTASSHTKEGMMPEISLLMDSTADLQPCKLIPSGIRSMLGPFLLLTSHALFRHPVKHHVKPQQLPHLQRLSLILHLTTFPALFSVHWNSAPNTSSLPTPATRPWPLSLNPFSSQDSAAAYLEHTSTHGHPHYSTRRPDCASFS